MTTAASSRTVTLLRLAVVLFVLIAIYLFRDNWLPEGYSTETHLSPPIPNTKSDTPQIDAPPPPQPCSSVPGADNVMIMLKTGATELYQKLPTHFLTTFKCIPHFMIFSDLAQTFADYPVHDAIAPISQHFRDHHADFELYRKLAQYKREGQDMSQLKGFGSWELDKWKFLPMMHQAFTTAGDHINWFVMIEADTSISWTNLLQWLAKMDPKKPYYLGSQNFIGATEFAHGGSGVVFSRRAADMFEEVRQKQGQDYFDEKWEDLTSNSCCGDEVIARALLEAGIHLTPSWPIIQGETVASLDWTSRHWCSVALSWHHVSPTEIDALWQFESDWVADHGWSTPYLYRDVFEHFIARHVSVNRTAWNNLSNDYKFLSRDLGKIEDYDNLQPYEQAAPISADACAAACLRKPSNECIQWMYSPGRCHLGRDIRFGKTDERGSEEHWTSGWIQERLEKFRNDHKGCKPKWTF